MRELYADFAAACGTFWLVLMVFALLTQSSIDTGMVGFPVVALIYAMTRERGRPSELERLQRSIESLQRQLNEQRPTQAL